MMPKKGSEECRGGRGGSQLCIPHTGQAMLPIEQNPGTKMKGRRAVVVGYICMSVVCTLNRLLILIFIH
jgi:hypothetical protein